MKNLTAKELDENHILIDVRTPGEFRSEKIPGSTNIPLDQIEEQGSSLQHQENLVIVCGSGQRAQKACAALRELGVQACVLEGGIKAYKAADLDLERGSRGVISLERQVRIIAGGMAAAGGILAVAVDPNWGLLSAFVGCGLVFAGATDSCAMATILAKLPYNRK